MLLLAVMSTLPVYVPKLIWPGITYITCSVNAICCTYRDDVDIWSHGSYTDVARDLASDTAVAQVVAVVNSATKTLVWPTFYSVQVALVFQLTGCRPARPQMLYWQTTLLHRQNTLPSLIHCWQLLPACWLADPATFPNTFYHPSMGQSLGCSAQY